MSKKSSIECFRISSLSDCNLSEESGNISLPEKSRNYTQLMIFLELHFQPLYYASGEAPWSLVMNFFWGNVQIWKQELNNFPLATNYRHRRERGGGYWIVWYLVNTSVFSRLNHSWRSQPLICLTVLCLVLKCVRRIVLSGFSLPVCCVRYQA